MKKNPSFSWLLLLLAVSCGETEKKQAEPESDLNVVINFVRAALDGKFNEAKTYMIQDSLNLNLINVAERSFNNLSQEIKDGYRASSIRFPSPMIKVNDSTRIIIYSNSYMNNPDTLKVLRMNGQWLVDFKYLYQHE